MSTSPLPANSDSLECARGDQRPDAGRAEPANRLELCDRTRDAFIIAQVGRCGGQRDPGIGQIFCPSKKKHTMPPRARGDFVQYFRSLHLIWGIKKKSYCNLAFLWYGPLLLPNTSIDRLDEGQWRRVTNGNLGQISSPAFVFFASA